MSIVRQMVAAGLPPPDHLNVGRGASRATGRRSTRGTSCIEHRRANGSSVFVGAFGHWALQVNEKIDVDWRSMDAGEAKRLRDEAAARDQAARRERERRAMNAANRARSAWRNGFTIEQAAERKIASEYLARKGVDAEGCRLLPDGQLLVPMYVPHEDGTGGAKLVGLQRIMPDGTKRFSSGCAKGWGGVFVGQAAARWGCDSVVRGVRDGAESARGLDACVAGVWGV